MAWDFTFEFENEAELKLAFANLFLRYEDAFRAGLELFPNDTPRALWVAQNWKNDPAVEDARLTFLDGDDMALLPSKRDAALMVWKIASNEDLTPFERLGAWDRYAAIRGFIEKPGTSVNLNVQNNVMQVTDHGSAEDWQMKARAQQQALTSAAYIDGDASAAG